MKVMSSMKQIHSFSYPIYAVDVVGRCALAVAGGGGDGKTGVPNRIDVVHLSDLKLSHKNTESATLVATIGGTVDTGTEAVMNLSVSRAGEGSFVFSLEGHQCVEYLAHRSWPRHESSEHRVEASVSTANAATSDMAVRNRRENRPAASSVDTNDTSVVQSTAKPDDWELVRLRSFCHRPLSLPGSCSSGILTCVCTGGPGGSWLAVGSDVGSVFVIHLNANSNWEKNDKSVDLKAFATFPDVSCGRSAGVYNIALTSPLKVTSTQPPATTAAAATEAMVESEPSPLLLATVCYQPSSDVVRIWRIDSIPLNVAVDCKPVDPNVRPYAMASVECFAPVGGSSSKLDNNQSPSSTPTRLPLRFKHCQFLRMPYSPPNNDANPCHILATTVEALRATRNSVSRLALWRVPGPNLKLPAVDADAAGSLCLLAQTDLPRGHKPACLSTHPSRNRAILAVGTLEGQVRVYCLSKHGDQLTCVYSMDKAHPTFVTALVFLPPHPWSRRTSHIDRNQSYELVSVSIDQSLRWHRGPTYLRVGRLARGLNDPEGGWLLRRRFVSLISVLFWTVIILFLPVYFALLSRMLG